MTTCNIQFYEEIWKSIPYSSLNTLLMQSVGWLVIFLLGQLAMQLQYLTTTVFIGVAALSYDGVLNQNSHMAKQLNHY